TGGRPEGTPTFAEKRKIPHWTSPPGESLRQPGLDAGIIASPTQIHAHPCGQALRAGKTALSEIPNPPSVAHSPPLPRVQHEAGVIAMAGHVRRFNPSHQWVHKRIRAGELTVQQMDVQTYFFRRTNMNAAGQPRTWTDHLLWHHACHTVDLFMHQTGEQA